ncbi:PIG-L family deacetylase [Tsukamurella sp. 8F]|uniref:PIG-L deacetylase family protein n=1 Tax=unclassified Tsukamurella TaxID=2633480 RepID=UPI0023B8CD42|nr:MULTISPECIES: PIG-L deacetylase family protein [unclassified Tsukamurella]MDF0531174.1 PIG-L family deacetylase [Tsukamurella sp. 8J]MDF0585879.1 PIG-L family deacetylase [Tsukamurella sp. 8F]
MSRTAPKAPHGTVLVVTAHPDDAEFGAGGTLAMWRATGAEVVLCICTSGEAGEGALDGPELAAIRRREQLDAAALLGIDDVRFLDHPDGMVVADLILRRDISRVIRQVRPHRVLTHCPTPDWSHIAACHPDHLAVGTAAAAAVYPDSRSSRAHPELRAQGLEPWTVPELWMMTPPATAENTAMDVTDFVDIKLRALAAHSSQFDDSREVDAVARFQMRQAAARHEMPGRFAEVFQAVRSA